MKIEKHEVSMLTARAAREMLKRIIVWLDELDHQDYFGTEGWRHAAGEDDA